CSVSQAPNVERRGSPFDTGNSEATVGVGLATQSRSAHSYLRVLQRDLVSVEHNARDGVPLRLRGNSRCRQQWNQSADRHDEFENGASRASRTVWCGCVKRVSNHTQLLVGE